MTIELNDQHFHEAIVKLIGPFWGKPRIAALIQGYLDRVQVLENRTFDVIWARDVRTADAARLTVLGRVVGQANFGWDLETYRAVIKAKIRTNRSRALTDDLIEVVRLITGTTNRVHVEHFSPATVLVWLDDPITDAAQQAAEFLLPKARGAGIQLHFFSVLVGSAADGMVWDSFTWNGPDVWHHVTIL